MTGEDAVHEYEDVIQEVADIDDAKTAKWAQELLSQIES